MHFYSKHATLAKPRFALCVCLYIIVVLKAAETNNNKIVINIPRTSQLGYPSYTNIVKDGFIDRVSSTQSSGGYEVAGITPLQPNNPDEGPPYYDNITVKLKLEEDIYIVSSVNSDFNYHLTTDDDVQPIHPSNANSGPDFNGTGNVQIQNFTFIFTFNETSFGQFGTKKVGWTNSGIYSKDEGF